MAELEMSWYVLRAVSGKEAKVKEYIDAEIKNGRLGGHVAQVLIPTEKVVQIRNTPQVLGFLGGMDNPTPLRPSEVSRILGKVDEMNEEAVDLPIPFEVGDAVKVNEGPFAGFSGVVERVDNDKKKVTVTVKVFARSTDLDLGFTQIVKE